MIMVLLLFSMLMPQTRPYQIKLAAALNTDTSQSYRITLQDGTKFYMTAQCMGAPISVGGVDSITSYSTDLEIDSDIFRN